MEPTAEYAPQGLKHTHTHTRSHSIQEQGTGQGVQKLNILLNQMAGCLNN